MKTAIQLLVLFGLGLMSCQTAQRPISDADKQMIQKTVEGAIQAVNETHDFKAYVDSYYADNATVLVPNSEPATGKGEILAAFQAFGDAKFVFTINDINGTGDLAYVYGKYELELPSTGMKDHGKYVEIWKKQTDGTWKTIYDISNTSVPLAADTTKM